MLLNHGLNLHCLPYPTRMDKGCPAKNADRGRIVYCGALCSREIADRRLEAETTSSRIEGQSIGLPGNPGFGKWVETKLSGNANNWQIDRKSS
jgi:hypothetical protein